MTDDSKKDFGRSGSGKSGGENFEEYLAGNSPVSRTYAGLGDEGPSPELDARVLAEAETAVKVRSLPTRNKLRRWTIPLAVAATVMVSFSLVMSIVSEVEKPLSGRKNLNDVAERRAMADEEQAFTSVESMQPGRGQAGLAESSPRADEGKAEMLAEIPAEPSPRDAIEKELIYPTAMAAPARNTAAMSPLALGELERMTDTIRAYLGNDFPAKGSRDTQIPTEGEALAIETDSASSAAAVRKKDQSVSPEARLERILTLYDTNQSDAAQAAIVEFRGRFPDHPVSVLLLERGF